MVLLVDLESDDDDRSLQARTARFVSQPTPTQPVEGRDEKYASSQAEREVSFAAILTCYPYAGTDCKGLQT
jgi:hypothetical protein